MLDSRELGEEAILAALMGISEMMGDLTDLDELLDAIVRIAPRLVAADRCAIFLQNPRGSEFRVAHAFCSDPAGTERLMRLAIPRADMPKLVHKLVGQRIPVMLREGREPLLPTSVTQAFGVRSMLLVPLVYQEQVMGFITLDEEGRDHVFTSREVNVVQAIAAHAAVAIAHTRLVEAFRMERKRSDALADAVCDGVLAFDRHLRIVSISAGATALLGWTKEEAEGRPATEVLDDSGGTGGVAAIARRVVAGSARETGIVGLRARDGSHVPCEVTATAVPGTMGGTAEVLCALHRAPDDLTRRRPARK